MDSNKDPRGLKTAPPGVKQVMHRARSRIYCTLVNAQFHSLPHLLGSHASSPMLDMYVGEFADFREERGALPEAHDGEARQLCVPLGDIS